MSLNIGIKISIDSVQVLSEEQNENFLLLEDGSFILLEDGSKILLEG